MSRYIPRTTVTVSNEVFLEALIGVGVIAYCFAAIKESRDKKALLNKDTRTPYMKACDKMETILHQLKNEDPILAKIVNSDLGLLGLGNLKIRDHIKNVVDFGERLLKATSKPMEKLHEINERNDESDDDLDDEFDAAEAVLFSAIKPFANKKINGFMIELGKKSFESDYDIINKEMALRGLDGKSLGSVLVNASKALKLIPKIDDQLRYCNYSQSMTMFGYQYSDMLLDMVNQALDFVEASFIRK